MIEPAPEILKQAAGGDMAAFQQVYKAASGLVYNLALRITRNCADAEEVTQDVFMKVYRSLKDFRFRASFKTWIYRIAVNTAINRYRKSAREEVKRVDYDTTIATFAGSNSAAQGAIESDNQVRLNKLLDKLNSEQRACLVLREIESLSYRQIADVLKVPLNTVRSRLKRAREALLDIGKGADER